MNLVGNKIQRTDFELTSVGRVGGSVKLLCGGKCGLIIGVSKRRVSITTIRICERRLNYETIRK